MENEKLHELLNLISKKDLSGVDKLLQEGCKIDSYVYRGVIYCPLCFACRYGEEKIIERLLNEGLNPDGECWKRNDFNCPIRLSIFDKKWNIVKILIQNGADISYILTTSQVKLGRSSYYDNEYMTFWKDLEMNQGDIEEFSSFIGGLRIKKAK